jgi:hypothetical protein
MDERVMLKGMQPIELAYDAPSLSDATDDGSARRSFWGSPYPANGSKGEGAR